MTAGAELLADFAVGLAADEVPEPLWEAVGLHALDALGCGLAAVGAGAAPYVESLTDEAGPATALGDPEGRSPELAALRNGILCHALDFDDTHPASIAHVSAAVVPAALAAAEATGASGAELALALLVGDEVTCRVGAPVGDAFHLRGFHPTAICGVFGATAAVSRLRGLDSGQATMAFGIAGSMAGGLMAYLADGSATKPVHPGWMAHAAQFAVRLAAAGATGPAPVLEGRHGVYESFVGKSGISPEQIADGLGSRWETSAIAFKPYAACHFLHAPLDALFELHAEHGFATEQVERITLLSPAAGIDLIAVPAERKRRPATPYEAKFSAPFSFAAALVLGRADPSIYAEELLHDPRLLALADRVDHELRDYETYPESMPGGVRVELGGGERLERELPHQRGGAGNPMAAAEVIAKYRGNAAAALDDAAIGAVEETMQGLRERPLDGLRALAGARPRS